MHYLLLALNKWIYLIQVASGECFFCIPSYFADVLICEQPPILKMICEVVNNLVHFAYVSICERPLIFCIWWVNNPLYFAVHVRTPPYTLQFICEPWSVDPDQWTEPVIFCSWFENDPLYLADVLICEWSLIFCSWFVNTPYILQLICESWFVNNPSYLSPDLWTTPYIKQMVWFVNDPFMSFIFAADL